MSMFEDMANELFAEAGVDPVKNRWAWQQAVEILSSKMAINSALHGLSRTRVDNYEKQKRAIVNDLKKLREDGEISE